MSLHWMSVETRLGAFHIASHEDALVAVKLPGTPVESLWADVARILPGSEMASGTDAVLLRAAEQIREYAQGVRTEFDVPIRLHGTEFQKEVWHALQQIPVGETASYADIAEAIGRPGAARAVGGANRANRIPLVVPCHRVIAADGSLGGYMGQWGDGAGLGLKQQLLDMERRAVAQLA